MPDAFLVLRRIHLFAGLKDDQIREAAKNFVFEEREPNTAIFHQGDAGEAFYVIQYGTVAVVREKGTKEQTVAKLSEGDYFGEMALIYGRKRNATVQTVTQAGLWRLEAEGFNALLRQFPRIKDNLTVAVDTRRDVARHHFKWLEPEEFIYLIAGKKTSLFVLTQIVPGLAILGLSLGIAGGTWYFSHTPLALYLSGPVALIAAGWMLWNYVDWSNDLYIVTSKRVVDYEKVVLIYESRNEAPLSTVRNVTLTTDQLGRILGYGNVVVNTFSGPIVFKQVPNPQAVADLIQEQLNRTRTRAAQTDHEALKRSLRTSMGLEQRPSGDKTGPVQPVKKEKDKGRPSVPNPLTQLRDHFTFRGRAEAAGVVTYRKHPYILLLSLWAPSALFIGLAALLGLRLGGILSILPGIAFFVAWLIPAIAVCLWWLYQYEDWRNDIYQITSDQIVDIARTPLGQETRKSASIDNILSVKTERPGFLAWLLNFGTVVIQTGPGGEMRFYDVYSPLEVQQDIFRRQEAKKSKAAADQLAAERDRLSKVLGAFQEINLEEQRRQLEQRRGLLREEADATQKRARGLAARLTALGEILIEATKRKWKRITLQPLLEMLEQARRELSVALEWRTADEETVKRLTERLEVLEKIPELAADLEGMTPAELEEKLEEIRQTWTVVASRLEALEVDLGTVEHELRLVDENLTSVKQRAPG